MAGRGPRGGRDGDASSDDEAPAPRAVVLPPRQQWEIGNLNAAANVGRFRTTEERRAAQERKDRDLIEYLRGMGVPEVELERRFRVPGNQGPHIDPYIHDSRALCQQIARKRWQYFEKRLRRRQDDQTKKEMNGIQKEIAALEQGFTTLCSRVTDARGYPMRWPAVFDLSLDRPLK